MPCKHLSARPTAGAANETRIEVISQYPVCTNPIRPALQGASAGVIFVDGIGSVIGDIVLKTDLVIVADEILTLPEDSSLGTAEGAAIINKGHFQIIGQLHQNIALYTDHPLSSAPSIHLNTQQPSMAAHGLSFSMTLIPGPGFGLPKQITITVESDAMIPPSTELTNGTDYTYKNQSGQIEVFNITAPIQIAATGVYILPSCMCREIAFRSYRPCLSMNSRI